MVEELFQWKIFVFCDKYISYHILGCCVQVDDFCHGMDDLCIFMQLFFFFPEQLTTWMVYLLTMLFRDILRQYSHRFMSQIA